MQHIRSISDLNPQSVGFANRGAESVNIVGHVIEDLLNGFGEALSGIANAGRSRTIQTPQGNPILPKHFPKGTAPNPNDPDPREAMADAIRVQHDIDKNIPQI